MPTTDLFGGKGEQTFLEKEVPRKGEVPAFVQVQTAIGVWIQEGTLTDNQRPMPSLWVTVPKAEELYKLPKVSLERWSTGKKPCRFLADREHPKGRTIKHRRVKGLRGREVVILLVSDLDTIAEKRQPPPSKVDYVDSEGRKCLDDEQLVAVKEFNVSKIFPDYWRSRPSELRPGEKALRAEKKVIVAKVQGGPSEKWINVEDDVKAILAGKETKCPGTGQGPRAELFRRRLLAAAEASKVQPNGNGAACRTSNGQSNISSNNSKKIREPYKPDLLARILRLVERYKKRGRPLSECFEEAAEELGLKVGAVKMQYYRHPPSE
jgi:hypothetical protein